jgi:hypothetical protein
MEFNSAEEGRKMTAKGAVRVNFYVGEYRFSDEFMVIEGLSNGVIIGAKTLQAWRFKLDFEKDEIIIDPKVTKLWLLANIYRRVPYWNRRFLEHSQRFY